MSEHNTEEGSAPEVEQAPESQDHIAMQLPYAQPSRVVSQGDDAVIALFGTTSSATAGSGSSVGFNAKVGAPLRLREAFHVLNEIAKSDFRQEPRDRSAHLAYQRDTGQASGADAFEAQREYFEMMANEGNDIHNVLDPLVTVHPDRVLFEVFSADEGSYASLSVDWEELGQQKDVTYGTTTIDFSDMLLESIDRLRDYRDTYLEVGTNVSTPVNEDIEPLDKKLELPVEWLRGFLQVQSSSMLDHTSFSLAPVDLYNVLRHLRLNADVKRKGRAMRVELMPGEHPRIALEPWEEVVETTSAPYKGRVAQVVRIWGRRRLMLVSKLLPFIDRVDVHLLGTGLPSFYVLRCGPLSLTLGLTGFMATNWSQALSLDTMLPRTDQSSGNLDRIVAHLQGTWVLSKADIESQLKLSSAEALEALKLGCQNGQLMTDIAHGVYRLRPVLQNIDLEALEFRTDRERQAYDVFHGTGGSVKIESENHLVGVGVQYVGIVEVNADRREYRCEMTIDDEGRVKRVKCTSAFYRKHQLKEGPSAPLIALRLKIAEQQRERHSTRGANTVIFETRTYVKRHANGEEVVQVSLEKAQMSVQWGERLSEKMRSQRLMFNSVDDARRAYFARIHKLESKGFLDATAS